MASYINAAARLARLMFDMGAQGKSRIDALNAALVEIPTSPFSGQLKAALRKYFD